MIIFPDLEGACRTWLRNHPFVGPLIDNKHAYFGVPNGDNPPSPMIIVSRLGGAPQDGEVPLDDGRVEFAVWGNTKMAASQVERMLCAALHDMGSVQMSPDVVGYGARVESRIWLPEENSNAGRYLVDAIITARAGTLLPA